MVKRLSLQMLLLGIIILSACKDNEKSDPNEPTITANYEFTTSKTLLDIGVSYVDEVLSMTSNNELNIKLSAPVEIDPIRKDAIKRIANINALGEQVVSDIFFSDKYVFVSYTSQGQDYGSNLDVYLADGTAKPSRLSRFIFPKINIQAVGYVEGRLYLAAISDSLQGFVETIIYNPSLDFTPRVESYLDIPALSVQDIAIPQPDSHLYAYVLGDNVSADGTTQTGVYIFDKSVIDVEHIRFVPVEGALALQVKENNPDVYVLKNNMKITQVTSSGATSDITVGLTAQLPNVGFVANEKFYIRSGNQLNIMKNDNSLKQSGIVWNENSSTESNSNYRNLAIMRDWLLIMGNGGTGIHVCGLRNRDDVEITEIKDITVGQKLACLVANDNYAFVAEKQGRLQILQRTTTGMPESPIYEQDLKELHKVTSENFPPSKNNYLNHLNLFMKDVDGTMKNPNLPLTIKVTGKTKIYVSIVNLGGSMASSLGYYLFNSNYLPAVTEVNQILLFPNTKTTYDIGNTVAMCDNNGIVEEFEAGQEIGFYFIPNGWGAKGNIQPMYTHLEYNKDGSQQHVLYKFIDFNPILIGFEDIWIVPSNIVSNNEIDFDDIIISISDNLENKPISKLSLNNIPIGTKN